MDKVLVKDIEEAAKECERAQSAHADAKQTASFARAAETDAVNRLNAAEKKFAAITEAFTAQTVKNRP